MASGPTRRQLVLLAATALGTILPGRPTLAGPADQGIGGTGFSLRPADEDGDRGIGGTGVIGTIRKFGSIVVNDMRIAYPPDVSVRIDDRPASVADLKLGQVVRVVAAPGKDGALSTRVIDVTSEVVGRIDRVTPKTLTVLGQTVSTAGLKTGTTWAVGDRVAVSGLRRNDGTIAASLIEATDRPVSKVVGPVVTAADGSARIGGIKLTGVDGTLIGQRAIVEGQPGPSGLAVTRSVGETTLIPPGVRALSVEAFVERRGESLRLGSGLSVGGTVAALPAGRSVRAVLTTVVARDGQLSVATVRTNGNRYPATDRGGATTTRPDGSRPLDLGRTPAAGDRPSGSMPNDPVERSPLERPRPPGSLFGPPGGLGPGGPGFGPRGGGPPGGGHR